jgi:hypothetical protein
MGIALDSARVFFANPGSGAADGEVRMVAK